MYTFNVWWWCKEEINYYTRKEIHFFFLSCNEWNTPKLKIEHRIMGKRFCEKILNRRFEPFVNTRNINFCIYWLKRYLRSMSISKSPRQWHRIIMFYVRYCRGGFRVEKLVWIDTFKTNFTKRVFSGIMLEYSQVAESGRVESNFEFH